MRDTPWNRTEVAASLKDDVWRYLTQTARTDEDLALGAARLLQMSPSDVLTLAQMHFVLSDEVGALLGEMPRLARRLATTSVAEREESADRVRGYIRWGETVAARAATGLPHLFVTSPARRAFDTDENRLLVFALDSIARFGRMTGWARSTSAGVGETVRERVNQATRWSRMRALAEVPACPATAKALARVRASRRRRAYAEVLTVAQLHRELIARVDRGAVRSAVEDHALVTRTDSVLLELLCAFRAMRALADLGWKGEEVDLLRGGKIFSARKGRRRLDLYYQRTPAALARNSRYRAIQAAHDFATTGWMVPDLVAELTTGSGESRWLLIEVKGVERPIAYSAREAVRDLLAYRRAFGPALAPQDGAYGLGVAWGTEVRPAAGSEVVVCSPDTLPEGLERALPA